MLSKLGWSQGQKLGKNQTGLLEPVCLLYHKNQLCFLTNFFFFRFIDSINIQCRDKGIGLYGHSRSNECKGKAEKSISTNYPSTIQ